MVIREKEAAAQRLVKEGGIPKESVLHKELMSHPELVPATDLGLGQVAAVGFEADLASGYADLVLLDDHGRLCIVEVKKEGNSDTRRVVAQLLDYAAALWGLTLEQFDRTLSSIRMGTQRSCDRSYRRSSSRRTSRIPRAPRKSCSKTSLPLSALGISSWLSLHRRSLMACSE